MLERYSRQWILPEIGEEGQKKLQKSKILIVGAGGLGSPALSYLAMAGIGTLGVIDADLVEESNLGRQNLHRNASIGQLKVDSAKQMLSELNPEIEVVTYPNMLRSENAFDIVDLFDFVIDGSDNFTTKFLVNDVCYFTKTAFSHAGVLGFEGQTLTYVPLKESPCYRCLFTEPPPAGVVPNCSEAGILGPVVGLIGCIQATEAIKFITEQEHLLSGTLLTYNALKMQFRKIAFKKNPSCPLCGENPSIENLREDGVTLCQTVQDSKTHLKAWILTFKSTQLVLRSERILKAKGIKVEPRVTPRQLSHECGICLEVEIQDINEILGELKKARIETSRHGQMSRFYDVGSS